MTDLGVFPKMFCILFGFGSRVELWAGCLRSCHVAPALSMASGNQAELPSTTARDVQNWTKESKGALPPAVFHKTRMCRFHLVGKCVRGSQCLFAHSRAALRASPDFTCTRMCTQFIEAGECDDPSCRYAHSRDIGRTAYEPKHHKERTVRLKTSPK